MANVTTEEWRYITGDSISADLSLRGDYVVSHRRGCHTVSYRPTGKHEHVGQFATKELAYAAAEVHENS